MNGLGSDDASNSAPVPIKVPAPLGLMDFAACGGILLVAFGIRMYGIDAECLWLDELLSYQFLADRSLDTFLLHVREVNAPTTPLYFYLEYYWARWILASVTGVRVLSILAGLASVGAAYAFGTRCFGRWAGATAAIGLALCPRSIYFDQEIRMYALLVALAAISMYALWRALYDGSDYWLAVHIAVNLCLGWTHLLGVFLVAAQAAWVGMNRKRIMLPPWLWGVLHAPMALSLLWYALSMDTRQAHQGMLWVKPPGLVDLLLVLLRPASLPHVRDFSVAVIAEMAVTGTLLGLAGFALLRAHRRMRPCDAAAFSLLLLWWIVPALLLFAVSLTARPLFAPRYVLYMLPAFYLMLGALVARLPHTVLKVWAVAGMAAGLIGMQAIAPRPWRADWRAVGALIAEHGQAGDTLLVTRCTNFMVAKYYIPEESQVRLACVDSRETIPRAIFAHAKRSTGVWIPQFPPWVAGFGFEAAVTPEQFGGRVESFALPGSHTRALRCKGAGAR